MIQKKTTNYLLSQLVNAGYNPSDFVTKKELLTGTVRERFTIYLSRQKRLWFQIENTNEDSFEKFNISQSIYNPLFTIVALGNNRDIDFTGASLVGWLRHQVSEYIYHEDELDYWEIIKQHPLQPGFIDFSDNLPFTEVEKAQLRIGFTEIKKLLSENFDLNAKQVEATNEKLDKLVDSVDRLHKSEWKNFALNVIGTIASELLLDDQKRATFLGLFSKLWAVVQHLPTIVN